MPRFQFAYDRNNKLVNALSLSRDENSDCLPDLHSPFRCAGCDAEVVAKVRGEKKEKHFAHKARTTCSEETYLHRLAKQTFHDVYQECLETGEPFNIVLVHPQVCDKLERYLERKCQRGTIEKSYDLTCYYDSVTLERREGEFIPDVLLSDSTGKKGTIYVEIAVTHFLSERKRDSEARIIEIPIENEEDITKIRTCRLTEADASFLNFPRYPAPVTDSGCPCVLETFSCLFIYQNGLSVLECGTMRQLLVAYKRNKENLAYARLITQPEPPLSYRSHGDRFKALLEEARSEGFPVRNCLICRYAGRGFNSFSGDPIFCKYKRRGCKTNEAVDCNAFRPSEQVSDTIP